MRSRVGDGVRTHGDQIHSLVLYHLSYTHREIGESEDAVLRRKSQAEPWEEKGGKAAF